MGQTTSSNISSSAPTIGMSNIATTTVGAFALNNSSAGESILVPSSSSDVSGSDVSGTFFTLPPSFSLQLQNGSLSNSGAQYLGLKALTNANYRSFTIPTTAVADIYGIVPTLCVYYAQICPIDVSQSIYSLTLYITPSVTADDPVILLEHLAVREYTFVGDSNVINVDFPYVVYNTQTGDFETITAFVTITMNYTPNTLVASITNGTGSSTTVLFNFSFNGNKTSVSDIPTYPYIAETQLSTAQVGTLNKNALYNIGTSYMGAIFVIFSAQQTASTSCFNKTDTYGAQIGAYQNV